MLVEETSNKQIISSSSDECYEDNKVSEWLEIDGVGTTLNRVGQEKLL